jgi:hypothetical protein
MKERAMDGSFMLDRRAFLNRVAVSVGGVAIAAALPVSLLQASPVCAARDPCGDWTVDDMCGAYPPYAFRRDADQPHARQASVHLDGLDALFAV